MTGGMTVQEYLMHCFGGKRGGRRCKLNEIYVNRPPSDRKIEKARKSRFVCGHFSWASIERFGRGEGDYIFTFLREPRSRLRSFHRFMTNYPEDHLNENVQDRVKMCQNMSQCDMFTTANLDLRNMIDNYMVRQLSGHLTDYPIQESAWPSLLETAKRNLESMNYVGLQETYEADFAVIMRELNMPCLTPIPRENAIEEVVKRAAFKSKTYSENSADVRAAMAPLVRWDALLYRHALALREARAA